MRHRCPAVATLLGHTRRCDLPSRHTGPHLSDHSHGDLIEWIETYLD